MPPTAPGNQPPPELPPKWYVNLVKRHPQLEGLWDDPLLEHARTTLPPNRLVYWEGPVGAVLALIAYWVYTRMPGLAGNGLLGACVLLFPPLLTCAAGYMGSRVPRNPLKWLRSPASEEWHTFPMDPGRAARLVAFAELLGGSRVRSKEATYYALAALISCAVASVLVCRAEMIMLLGPAAIIVSATRRPGNNRATASMSDDYQMLLQAVLRLESFAEKMKIPPLSQDSTALSSEKRLMYGTISHEINFPVYTEPLPSLPTILDDIARWDGLLQEALRAFESCYTRWVKAGLEAKEE